MVGALGMIPAALEERRSNPYLERSEAAASYLETVANNKPVEGGHVPPWRNANKLYQLYCRLRWETDFRALFKS